MSPLQSVATVVTLLTLSSCARTREVNVLAASRSSGSQSSVTADAPTSFVAPSELPVLDEMASLDTYLQYAALNNPGVEAAFARWQAALARVPQARTLPDPKLTYARFIEEIETRVGPQENRLGVAQTFPWFGKLETKGNHAARQAEAARWRFEQAKLALFFRVTDAYAEYYYLGRATLITEENLALLGHFEEVARRRYEVAKASYSDVIKAQVELGKLTDRLRTLGDMRPALAAAVNAALNRPTDTPLPWPRTLDEPTNRYDPAALREHLNDENPELRALSSEIAAAVEGIELARLRYYPNVTVGLDWIDTDRALMPTPESGKDPVIAMVSVNLPLWYQSYRAAEQEAAARLRAATLTREERGNALSSQLERAVFRYDDARRKINLYRDTLLPKAQQALEATETSFTTGAADYLNLLDGQRILLEFQLSYERALTNSLQRDTEIRTLLGTALADAKPTE